VGDHGDVAGRDLDGDGAHPGGELHYCTSDKALCISEKKNHRSFG
jgi:hypothetical protein